MRPLRSYLRVDLTKLFCEDSDQSSDKSDDGNDQRQIEWRPRAEQRARGYQHQQLNENINPWGIPQLGNRNLVGQECEEISYEDFIRSTPRFRGDSNGNQKQKGGTEGRGKTYRIQTIGEVYALQKREGKELPAFRGLRESRTKNYATKRMAQKGKNNEPLLMGIGYASTKARRNGDWRRGQHNSHEYGFQDAGEDEAYTYIPGCGGEDAAHMEDLRMEASHPSRTFPARLPVADMTCYPATPSRKPLPAEWARGAGENPRIREPNHALAALLESQLESQNSPPHDAAALHSELFPMLYGGYGFPYEGPFFNPMVFPTFTPYPMAPPYPIGPIFPVGVPFPLGPPFPVELPYAFGSTFPTNPIGQQEIPTQNTDALAQATRSRIIASSLDPEALPWIPGKTPLTSNIPLSVLKKARKPDLYLLQGLEYVSQKESKDKRKDESKPNPENGCRALSTAEYAGLVVQNMTEESHPLLTKYLNPKKARDTRRIFSMPGNWGTTRSPAQGNSRRVSSWSHTLGPFKKPTEPSDR